MAVQVKAAGIWNQSLSFKSLYSMVFNDLISLEIEEQELVAGLPYAQLLRHTTVFAAWVSHIPAVVRGLASELVIGTSHWKGCACHLAGP